MHFLPWRAVFKQLSLNPTIIPLKTKSAARAAYHGSSDAAGMAAFIPASHALGASSKTTNGILSTGLFSGIMISASGSRNRTAGLSRGKTFVFT